METTEQFKIDGPGASRMRNGKIENLRIAQLEDNDYDWNIRGKNEGFKYPPNGKVFPSKDHDCDIVAKWTDADDLRLAWEPHCQRWGVAYEELHNPAGLTPEQVEAGDGWRLALKAEVRTYGDFSSPLKDKCAIWLKTADTPHWLGSFWKCNSPKETYRTREPLPNRQPAESTDNPNARDKDHGCECGDHDATRAEHPAPGIGDRPLGPADFPPGTAMKCSGWPEYEWAAVLRMRGDGVVLSYPGEGEGQFELPYYKMDEWLRLLPGETEWRPCRKEDKPVVRTGASATMQNEEARAKRIAARARELQRNLNIGFTQAYNMAQGEK